MLHWAIILFVLGLMAALLGFGGIASTALGIAKGLILLKIVGVILVLAAIAMLVRHTSLGGAGTRRLQ
jgi:uncharacterized membrane protein YtjA (UPF0391 family)